MSVLQQNQPLGLSLLVQAIWERYQSNRYTFAGTKETTEHTSKSRRKDQDRE